MILYLFRLTVILLWALLLIPIGFLLLECCAAILGRKRAAYPPSTLDRVQVLIAAHNEEAALPTCLDSLLTQGLPADQITVVADRCTDRTAEIARGVGAQVIEHANAAHPYKGVALAHALKQIDSTSYDVLIMADGDSWLEVGALIHLASAVRATGRPVQGLFLQQASSPTSISALSEFAFRVKNLVRPLGLAQIGAPCLLCGSGMAFPSGVIQPSMLNADFVAEDYHLTVQLARAGHSVLFCPEARIISRMYEHPDAASRQRSRWERDHLTIALREALPLIGLAVQRRQAWLAALALELAVPPLAMLSTLITVLLLLSGMLVLLGETIPLGVGIVVVGLFGVSILLAWLGFGRRDFPPRLLLSVPHYAISKLPVYLNVLRNEWAGWRQRIADR